VRPEALAFHKRWYPERAAEYGEDVARSLEAARDIDPPHAARRGLLRPPRPRRLHNHIFAERQP
jgi:hypothetical protein